MVRCCLHEKRLPVSRYPQDCWNRLNTSGSANREIRGFPTSQESKMSSPRAANHQGRIPDPGHAMPASQSQNRSMTTEQIDTAIEICRSSRPLSEESIFYVLPVLTKPFRMCFKKQLVRHQQDVMNTGVRFGLRNNFIKKLGNRCDKEKLLNYHR